MALLNYLFPGSYLVVGDVTYNDMRVGAVIYVFDNQQKENLCLKKEIFFERGEVPIVQHILVNDIPENVQIGESWLTAIGYTDFHGHNPDGHLIVTKTDVDCYFYTMAKPFYNVPAQSYQIANNGNLLPYDPWNCPVLFERYFNMQDDSNIIGNVYRFLNENIGEFKNCSSDEV